MVEQPELFRRRRTTRGDNFVEILINVNPLFLRCIQRVKAGYVSNLLCRLSRKSGHEKAFALRGQSQTTTYLIRPTPGYTFWLPTNCMRFTGNGCVVPGHRLRLLASETGTCVIVVQGSTRPARTDLTSC